MFACKRYAKASFTGSFAPLKRGLPANHLTRSVRYTASSFFASKLGAYK
jgi:hypothetical protein